MRLQSKLLGLFLAMALLPLLSVVIVVNSQARNVVVEEQLERRRAQSEKAVLAALASTADQLRLKMDLVLAGREVQEHLFEPLENGTYNRDLRRHLDGLLNLGAGHDVLYFLDESGEELAVAHMRDTRVLASNLSWFEGRPRTPVLRPERLQREGERDRLTQLTLQMGQDVTPDSLRRKGRAVYVVVGRILSMADVEKWIPPGGARLEVLAGDGEPLYDVSIGDSKTGPLEVMAFPWPNRRSEDLPSVIRLHLDVGGERAQLARLNRAALWLAGLSALVALILAWLNARGISRPLAQLTESAGRLARGEGAVREIDQTGGYEVSALSRAFRSMSDDLSRAEADKLEAVRLAAYAKVAQRVGHEVKNPLTSVQLNLEYLKKVLGDDAEEYSVIFEESLREVGRIERIVSRFREAAKETDVSFADLDLAESLSRLCAFHAQGPCPVTYRGPKAHVMSGDADALKQVFTNLIRNAVEACAEQAQRKGEVCVTLKPLEGGGAEVEVADNGVGMSAETIENLFMPLYSTKERGSGLGLSVTSRLVRLHGGRVLVHSEMGRGSTFRVVFPQRKAETP